MVPSLAGSGETGAVRAFMAAQSRLGVLRRDLGVAAMTPAFWVSSGALPGRWHTEMAGTPAEMAETHSRDDSNGPGQFLGRNGPAEMPDEVRRVWTRTGRSTARGPLCGTCPRPLRSASSNEP